LLRGRGTPARSRLWSSLPAVGADRACSDCSPTPGGHPTSHAGSRGCPPASPEGPVSDPPEPLLWFQRSVDVEHSVRWQLLRMTLKREVCLLCSRHGSGDLTHDLSLGRRRGIGQEAFLGPDCLSLFLAIGHHPDDPR